MFDALLALRSAAVISDDKREHCEEYPGLTIDDETSSLLCSTL
jgi:hypothetical protein